MIDGRYVEKALSIGYLRSELKEEGFFGSLLRGRPNRVLWLLLRYLYWKNKFKHMGKNVRIYTGVTFSNPHKITAVPLG